MSIQSIPDLVVKNANIITVDSNLPKAQAFAIKNGKFIAIGSNDDIENITTPQTKIYDAENKTIIPGLIDAHIHVLSSGIRHVMAADCTVKDIQEVSGLLKDKVNNTPKGEWVQGFKYDDTKIRENRDLYRQDLDSISLDHPIMVSHRAGHVYYMNSKALELSGYHNESDDPHGGKLGRDKSTGKLNGVVYERAIQPTQQLLPRISDKDRTEGLKQISSMLNSSGLTSVHDARVSQDEFLTYQDGEKNNYLGLRVYMLMAQDLFPSLRDAGVKTGFGSEMLKVGGIKMTSDGAIAARTAWLSEPYIGSEDDCGIQAMSQEELDDQVIQMHNAGFQVAVHANGDSAISMVLNSYEKALELNPLKDTRHRIEHCTLVNPDILKRMAKNDVQATPFCTYVFYHGEKMQFYGEERLEWMFAQKSFIEYGVNSTGATDYPPGPYPPLMGIQSCITRTDSNGKLWGPSQKINIDQALKIYTLNGAKAAFEENIKGSISMNKLADFVVLDKDITKVDPFEIKDIKIVKTVIGGNTVYEG